MPIIPPGNDARKNVCNNTAAFPFVEKIVSDWKHNVSKQVPFFTFTFLYAFRCGAVLRARDTVQRYSMKNRFLKLDILLDLCAIDIQTCHVTIISII